MNDFVFFSRREGLGAGTGYLLVCVKDPLVNRLGKKFF